MKTVLVFLTGVIMAIAYDPQFDQFDAETAVKDPAVLEAIMKCLTNEGPCNEVAGAYKGIMPEVVMTMCSKCSPRQKVILKVVVGSAKNQFPELYETLKTIYDPANENGAALDAFVSSK